MENYNPIDFNPLASDNEFVNNLRQALQESYDAGVAALDNTRELDHTSIMSNANTAGMMYSNFPERDKIRYDTNTYMPNLVKLRNSYQTGLDALRNAGVDAANQAAYYEDMVNHYETLPTSSGSSGGSSASDIAKAVQQALGSSGSQSGGSQGSTTSGAVKAGLELTQQVMNAFKVLNPS